MRTLDTNGLVRFLTEGDPDQGRMARDLIGGLREHNPGFVARDILVDLTSGLEQSYRDARSKIARGREGFLFAPSWNSRKTTALAQVFSSPKRTGSGFPI